MNQLSRCWMVAMVSILGGVCSSLGTTYCVDPINGNDGNAGTWASPYKTLSNAVAKATGGGGHIIKVSQGTNTLTASAMAVQDQTVLGGYATPAGGVEGARDPVAYPTIIDGASLYYAFSKTAANTFTLDGFTVRNCTNSASGGAITASAGSLTILNCTFTNNLADANGGAINHTGTGSPNTYSNCTFIANACGFGASLFVRGGAIYFSATTTTNIFHGCSFVTNSVQSTAGLIGGGAISGKRDSAGGLMKFTSCIFSNNAVPNNGGADNNGQNSGGGAIFFNGTLDLSGGSNVFYGNYVLGSGGAIYIGSNATGVRNIFSNTTFIANSSGLGAAFSRGGAIYVEVVCTNVFQSCSFITNRALCNNTGGGGAISGNRTTAGGPLQFTSCVFSNNTSPASGNGGAIYFLGPLDLSGGNNVFYGNQAFGVGGAIYHSLLNAYNVFSNSTFTANVAGSGQSGGALHFASACTNRIVNCAFITNSLSGGNGNGGAIDFVGAGTYNLINSTFFANRATGSGQGGAIRTAASSFLNVTNCIFWGNVSGGTGTNIQNGGTVNLAYSDIDTNASAVTAGTARNFGSGITNANPLFVSMSAPYDVHLQSQYGHWTSGGWVSDAQTSPFIDAGDPTSDYSKEPAGSLGIELGAYGNTPQASKSRSGGTVLVVQ